MHLLSITEGLSRFHPLLVHLPIGILLFALFLTILPNPQRESLLPALSHALLLSAVFSVLSCITGYLLSLSGEYDPALVRKHQWAGIATAAMTATAWALKKWQRPLTWLSVLVMTFAAHQGGTLTHGEGFLFGPQEDAAAITAGEVADTVGRSSDSTIARRQEILPSADTRNPYHADIRPILQTNCYGCHSAVKRKGGLRLDSEAFIRKGGKSGAVLQAGDPGKSKLFTYLVLPADDELHMPPKGRKPLRPGEIDVIRRWIGAGAHFDAVPVTEAVLRSDPLPVQTAQEAPVEMEPTEVGVQTAAAALASIPAADAGLLEALRERDIAVKPVAGRENGLAINLVNVGTPDAETYRLLSRLQEQAVELKLTGQPVHDEDLRSLGSLRNLTHLQLERTLVTDGAMDAINGFTELQQLNLYGTGITDKGLAKLSRNRKLRKVHLWGTQVSPEGVQAFRRSNPGIILETGDLRLKAPDTTQKK